MNDTEVLNLIEHYQWAVSPQTGGGWVIDGGEDEDVIELARTRGSLRDAVKMAISNKVAGHHLAVK